MSNITLTEEDQKELKGLVVARKIALNFDYCLDEDEAKKEMKKLLKNYFNEKTVSKAEIVESCAQHQGLRYDEVESALARKLEEILKI